MPALYTELEGKAWDEDCLLLSLLNHGRIERKGKGAVLSVTVTVESWKD